MIRLLVVCLVALGAAVCISAGCGRAAAKHWQIVAQNQTQGPCEVAMDIGSLGGVNAPDLAGGERRVLRSGGETLIINTVKVVHNRQQLVFRPLLDVPVGKTYLVSVDPSGMVRTSITDM